MFLSAKDVLSPRVPTGTVTTQRDKKKEVVDGVVTTESPLKGVSLDLLEKVQTLFVHVLILYPISRFAQLRFLLN